MINEENKIYFSILAQGKDPDDIIKDSGKDGFLKFLENKIIIQSLFGKPISTRLIQEILMKLPNLKNK